MTPGDQSAALYGPHPRRRDRFGEIIDGDIAVDGASQPPISRTGRYDRLRGLSPVEMTSGELAYFEQYELCEAYPGGIDEMERAIRDWRATR